MKKKTPLASVIMPVYNSQKYLITAIKSVLNQSFTNFEFIIINDGSYDNSWKILQGFKNKDKRIHLINNSKNIGVTKSLNKGLKHAKGKYIIRMDADDWSYPDRFERQIKLMEANPGVVVSGSYINVCSSDLKKSTIRKYNLEDKEIRSRLFRYSPFAHPATIWRADVLKKEKYDENTKIGQDYELYFRIGTHGKFMNLNRVLLKLRMHDKSVSSSMNDLQSQATIKIRTNAVKNLGYKMSILDKMYNSTQSMLIHLIPVRLRFTIFNFLRKFSFF